MVTICDGMPVESEQLLVCSGALDLAAEALEGVVEQVKEDAGCYRCSRNSFALIHIAGRMPNDRAACIPSCRPRLIEPSPAT